MDPAELPEAKMVDRKKKGKGWYLSCQCCFHEWFHVAPAGFSWYEGGHLSQRYGKTIVKTYPKFSDKTEIDQLKVSQLAEQQTKYNQKRMGKSYSPFFDKWVHKTDIFDDMQEKVKSSLLYKTILMLLIFLIIFSACYILNPFQVFDEQQFMGKNLYSIVPESQKFFLQMQVKDICFEKIKENERVYLKVSGSILSPLNQEEILPPLKISVWTACDKNSIASSLSTGDPYCVVKAWEHEFEDPVIEAGAKKEFVTFQEIDDVDAKLLKVEATFS